MKRNQEGGLKVITDPCCPVGKLPGLGLPNDQNSNVRGFGGPAPGSHIGLADIPPFVRRLENAASAACNSLRRKELKIVVRFSHDVRLSPVSAFQCEANRAPSAIRPSDATELSAARVT